MAFKFVLVVLALVLDSVVSGAPNTDENNGRGMLSRLPGSRTAAGILASADGASRYFAAISDLSMRGGELLNREVDRTSTRLNNQAKRLANPAGQTQMPGMDAMESHMPASIANIGEQVHDLVMRKSNIIRSQAEAGIASASKLSKMMGEGFKMKAPFNPPKILSSTQELMVKGNTVIQKQLKQHLEGTMGRMSGVQSMTENIHHQKNDYLKTLSDGLGGTVHHIQKTGEKLVKQVHTNHAKNTKALGDMMSSFHGSMGDMGQNMHKNLEGVVRHAQSTAQQLSSSLQEAVQKPMEMLSQLGSNIGGMMQGAKGGLHMPSGGRY